MMHGTMSLKFTGYSCQILRKLGHSGHIFEKYSNTKFNENSVRLISVRSNVHLFPGLGSYRLLQAALLNLLPSWQSYLTLVSFQSETLESTPFIWIPF